MEELSIPEETVICISKSNQFFGFGIIIPVVALSVYEGVANKNYVGALIFMVASIVLSVIMYKRYKNRTPQIIINKKGMETASAGFFQWEEIGNEQTTSEYRGKDTAYCLEYDCPNGH